LFFPDNSDHLEAVHRLDEGEKSRVLSYEMFFRHDNNKYMCCKIINGFMSCTRN